jgi:hypothetical protein
MIHGQAGSGAVSESEPLTAWSPRGEGKRACLAHRMGMDLKKGWQTTGKFVKNLWQEKPTNSVRSQACGLKMRDHAHTITL